jgi:hypothetical protein
MRICPASFHERHELGRFQENQRQRGGHIYFALLAKWLRQHPTEAESRMWQILKTRPQGYTFRRQHHFSGELPTSIVRNCAS